MKIYAILIARKSLCFVNQILFFNKNCKNRAKSHLKIDFYPTHRINKMTNEIASYNYQSLYLLCFNMFMSPSDIFISLFFIETNYILVGYPLPFSVKILPYTVSLSLSGPRERSEINQIFNYNAQPIMNINF